MPELEPAHSELPPSSSDKWLKCHAWRRLTHGIEDVSSAAAEEGTRAHTAFERHLTLGEPIPDEFYDYLTPCVEWVQDQPGLLYCEERVDFGAWAGFVDLTGTSDLIIVDNDMLTIGDLKYGRGVVEVKSTQLMCYLVGAIEKFGLKPVYRLAILQPRAWHMDGTIRELLVYPDEVEVFKEYLAEAMRANYDPRSVATPGEHCQHFCKALGSCKAVSTHLINRFKEFVDE